ncbi:hypothetical protein [Gluconobacter morbifer]|uniref:Uncharacterized protein n=1 Tax=Gluconobacter morbifer G707 TaxID=1088869 RepID=G6XFR8_9PROT|nr:hypothetical protein [Gluconobacter morbifer]EHH69026.1 hypothetical protein GMO_03330 [Gluconobacter morbifer G707]
MAATRKSASFPKSRKATSLATRLGHAASVCILDVMINDRSTLIRDSAVFITLLEKIWKERNLESVQVWKELEARIELAEELRANRIRPMKGGRYRSTKLP